MALAIKLRNNFIVEKRSDLDQAIINNLAVFLDYLPLKLEYDLKIVSRVTLQDGTEQTGALQRVEVGRMKDGTRKYKTVVNRFLVMDIYAYLSETTRKKLTRVLVAPLNLLAYKPNTDDLKTISKEINNLIKGEMRKFGVTTPTTAEASPYKGFWAELSFKGIRYKIGPYAKQDDVNNAADKEVRQRRSEWNSVRTIPITEDEPNLPLLPNMVTWAQTIPGSLSGTTQADSGGNAGAPKPGANATSLLEWYQAQGKTLPTVAERAKTYEGFGLGPAGTYIATGEQNTVLLEKLKA